MEILLFSNLCIDSYIIKRYIIFNDISLNDINEGIQWQEMMYWKPVN